MFGYDGTSNLLITVLDNSAAAIGSAYAFKAHNAAGKSRYYGPFSTQPINPASLDASLGTALSYRSNMRIGSVDQADADCAYPQAAVVDGDSTTAVLMWVPGYYDTVWNVAFRMAGDTAWTTVDTGVTTAPYIIYNLVPSTSYEFLVSHQCNGDTYGDVAVFSTPCTQKDIPYTGGFRERWRRHARLLEFYAHGQQYVTDSSIKPRNQQQLSHHRQS